MKGKLKQLISQKYFLLVTRLRQPKDKVVEFLPILLASSVLKIYSDLIEGQIEQYFGILGFNNESKLFVYQWVLRMFTGQMEIPIETVD